MRATAPPPTDRDVKQEPDDEVDFIPPSPSSYVSTPLATPPDRISREMSMNPSDPEYSASPRRDRSPSPGESDLGESDLMGEDPRRRLKFVGSDVEDPVEAFEQSEAEDEPTPHSYHSDTVSRERYIRVHRLHYEELKEKESLYEESEGLIPTLWRRIEEAEQRAGIAERKAKEAEKREADAREFIVEVKVKRLRR